MSGALSLFKTLWGLALAAWQRAWIGYEFAHWLFKRNNPFQKSAVCLNVFYLIEQNSLFASHPCHLSGVCIGSNTLKHDCAELHARVEDSQFLRKMWRQPKVLWQIYSVLALQRSSTVPGHNLTWIWTGAVKTLLPFTSPCFLSTSHPLPCCSPWCCSVALEQ